MRNQVILTEERKSAEDAWEDMEHVMFLEQYALPIDRYIIVRRSYNKPYIKASNAAFEERLGLRN